MTSTAPTPTIQLKTFQWAREVSTTYHTDISQASAYFLDESMSHTKLVGFIKGGVFHEGAFEPYENGPALRLEEVQVRPRSMSSTEVAA